MTTLSTVHSGSYQPSATANPFTIELTGQIDANSTYALYLNADTTWYALNQGLITANSGDGIDLVSGTIVNQASIGGTNGVVISGTGSLINQGVVSGSSVGVSTGINGTLYVSNASTGLITGGFLAVGAQYSTGTVLNAGTLSGGTFGIYANAGLTLTNSGTILGTGGDGIKALGGAIDITNAVGGYILGNYQGIYLGAGAGGTVVNAGTFAHGGGGMDAINASAGDTIDVVVDPGAVFIGTVAGTATDRLNFAPGTTAGTFAGLGTQYTGFGSYTVDAGASWTAASTNILAAITIEGTLAIAGTATGPAVLDGGVLSILAGATLSQDTGPSAITGSGGYVTNAGTVTVTSGIYAISFNAGGTVDNGGLIAGRYDIGITGGAGTVTNTGTILATGGSGSAIEIGAGGTVENAGTIVAGTTSPGTYLDAVTFAAGAGNTMILDGGSTIRGTVDGGNTLGSTFASTLQLAGTSELYGLNTQYINFADVYLGSGADWALGGYTTILANQTVNGAGSINAGPGLLNQGTILVELQVGHGSTTITNAAGATISSASDAIYGYVGTGNTGSVLNAGTLIAGQEGIFVGGTAAITNLPGGLISATDHFFLTTGIFLGGGKANNQGTVASRGIGIFDGYRGYGVPTVTNSGAVIGYSDGVLMSDTAALTNAIGGTIAGFGYGIFASTGGFFGGTYGDAAIVNQGTILGDTGIKIAVSDTTVDNSGYIKGYTFGVTGYAATINVTNEAQGTILGYAVGVALTATYGATLTNAGTIAGGSGPAVFLASGAPNRLIVQPGATFYGVLDGGNAIAATVASTLEFAAGIGTLAGFGNTVVNFADITFDPSAQWLVGGPAHGFAYGETISGFDPGSTIELTGTVETYAALVGGMLTLSGGTTLDMPGLIHAGVRNDGINTFITACFASGTKIAGEFGPVPVEALREGDLVRTARGRLAPVKWLGFRRTDLARHPSPPDVMPVRVTAGAFGRGLPTRDLILSPDHAVFVRGRLIPIRYLINNISIVQESRASITYWHVELDRHDVILAEGLPCESYLDTGNRSAFANAPGAVQMTPDFARGIWAAQGCAPIVTDPADPVLRLLHTKLLARATRTRRAA